jgi:hypothetical protein
MATRPGGIGLDEVAAQQHAIFLGQPGFLW